MNARPVPMAETHKQTLLSWLRYRASYGQGAPSDRAIAQRLELRSTDDALALVTELASDGELHIEMEGLVRHLVLRQPPAPKGTRPLTREMMEAARAAHPATQLERAAPRARPAPASLPPPRPLYTPPADLPPAPIAPKPEEPTMPAVATIPIAKPSPPPVGASGRRQIKLNPLVAEYERIAARAAAEGLAMGTYALQAVLRQMDSPATAPAGAGPIGKPRLSARVIRTANADRRDFWAAISVMIELGATALAAEQAAAK